MPATEQRPQSDNIETEMSKFFPVQRSNLSSNADKFQQWRNKLLKQAGTNLFVTMLLQLVKKDLLQLVDYNYL